MRFLILLTCFLLTSNTFAQATTSSTIDPGALKGKQIKILDRANANKLFEKQQSIEPTEQIVLANGALQTLAAAQMAGAAVICNFNEVTINQNGYSGFTNQSTLEVLNVDMQTVRSQGLVQLEFTVRHELFGVAHDHLDRYFSCYNTAGTAFSREELDKAFGKILMIEN